MFVKTHRPDLRLHRQRVMDHCFYIAKCPKEPAEANQPPGGFWELPSAPMISGAVQKYLGNHSIIVPSSFEFKVIKVLTHTNRHRPNFSKYRFKAKFWIR